MSRRLLIIGLSTVLALALSGCHEQADKDETTAPTLTFTVLDAPESVAVGAAFSVQIKVEASSSTYTSDHVGAHWDNETTANQDKATLKVSDFDGKSPHQEAPVPTTYTITGWNFTAAGTYYYRPHLQLVIGETRMDFWGDEKTITVA